MRKGFLQVAIIFFLVFVLIISVTVYSQMKSKNIQTPRNNKINATLNTPASPSSQIINKALPLRIEDTTNWQTYSSENFKLSFKYPATRQIAEHNFLKSNMPIGDGEAFLNLGKVKQFGDDRDLGLIDLFLWYKDDKKLSLVEFINAYPYIKDSSKLFYSFSVDDKEALRQELSNQSTVYIRANNGYIYKIESGNFVSPTDKDEFDAIISSIKFFQ